MQELTSCALSLLGQPFFVASRELADRFVARCQRDHGQQRDDEGDGSRHAPAGEDDAEVGRVPGEEHLGFGELF